MNDKPSFFQSAFAVFYLFVSAALFPVQNPRLVPIPIAASLAHREEPLTIDLIIEASLAFSDVPPEDMSQGRIKIRNLIEQIRGIVSAVTDETEKAEAILAFMHEQVLKSYGEDQTRMDDLVEKGLYNCVSSALLYMILAKSLSIEVAGVRTVDHAFCLVSIGNRSYDVETTNRYGFDPGSKKEFYDEFGKATGYSYVPPNQYGQRTTIDERELLSIILHNRASLYGRSRRYVEAVGPSIDAFILLGSEDAYDKMLISFVNLASWYNLSGEYEVDITLKIQHIFHLCDRMTGWTA